MRRYFDWKNFIDPIFVKLGFIQSFFILLFNRPKVVFSKGGYVSLPVVLAAYLLRIPIILHESDSRMGLANKIAAKLANMVCVSFPDLQKALPKARLTGNPIRPEILIGQANEGYKLTGFNNKMPIILIWGGSQGARQINKLLHADFDQFMAHFQVIHITGAGKKLKLKHPHYKAFEYLGPELKHIYAITNLIIGRAGANSIYEVALLQKPNILIPLGNTDQLNNAAYFNEAGATCVYQKGQKLFELTQDLWQNTALKASMQKALKQISKPKAAQDIAKLILNT